MLEGCHRLANLAFLNYPNLATNGVDAEHDGNNFVVNTAGASYG